MISIIVENENQAANNQTIDLKTKKIKNVFTKTGAIDCGHIKVATYHVEKPVAKYDSTQINYTENSSPKREKTPLFNLVNNNAQSLFESEKMSLMTIKNEIDEAQSIYDGYNNNQFINVNFYTKNRAGAKDDNITL